MNCDTYYSARFDDSDWEANLPVVYKPRDPRMVSAIMRRVRSKDTFPEKVLRTTLWRKGLRYRIHRRDLPGCPDIVFPRQRLAVFVDGDFWHGRQWQNRGLASLATQFSEHKAAYWVPKIGRNVERDKETNAKLESMGWRVLRFWESDVTAHLNQCVRRVIRELEKTKTATR